MYCYAYSIVLNEDMADEALGDAFLGIVRNVETVYNKTELERKLYIITCVKNACYYLLNKQSVRMKNEIQTDWKNDKMFDENDGYFDEYDLGEDDFIYLHKAINKLSERSKSVVLLKYQGHYSYKEIAKVMGISISQVGVVLNRAKAKIKNIIITEVKKHENE